jgi:hypothetical protein
LVYDYFLPSRPIAKRILIDCSKSRFDKIIPNIDRLSLAIDTEQYPIFGNDQETRSIHKDQSSWDPEYYVGDFCLWDYDSQANKLSIDILTQYPTNRDMSISGNNRVMLGLKTVTLNSVIRGIGCLKGDLYREKNNVTFFNIQKKNNGANIERPKMSMLYTKAKNSVELIESNIEKDVEWEIIEKVKK